MRESNFLEYLLHYYHRFSVTPASFTKFNVHSMSKELHFIHSLCSSSRPILLSSIERFCSFILF